MEFLIKFWDDLTNGVTAKLVGGLSAGIPKLLMALIIAFIGWSVARLMRKVIKNFLRKINIDGFADKINDIDIVQNTNIQLRPSGIISSIIYYMIMLLTFVTATDVMGIAAISNLLTDLINYLPALFTAFVVLVFGVFVADGLRKVVKTACDSLGIPSAKIISSIVFYLVFITIAVTALSQAKIQTDFIATNLTVIIGAFAFAFAIGYGLASRDMVSNFLASYYQKGKVMVGDEISVEGVKGRVVAIDASSIILQTNDRAIIIPISKLVTEKIEVFYPEGQTSDLLEDRREKA